MFGSDFLINLSRNPSFNWAKSLDPIRLRDRPGQKCGTCAEKRRKAEARVPLALAEAVAKSPLFAQDADRVRLQLGLTELVIQTSSGQLRF